MSSPEAYIGPSSISGEEILLEAHRVVSDIGYPFFLRDYSEFGHMFDTGNFGGPKMYHANEVYRTPMSFDFTEFDDWPGESKVDLSIFATNNHCIISFFNISRDCGEKFTYGVMLSQSSNREPTELIHREGEREWGMFVDRDDKLRESVLSWLRSLK